MYVARKQRTIAHPVAVEGFGYWSGRDVRIEFHPAAADTGVVFVRTDLKGRPRIPANVHYRTEVPRRTVLARGETTVDMVEHVMAALAGLAIDNCEVWSDAAEMPASDGSSIEFVNALMQAGFVAQEAERAALLVDRTIRLGDHRSWIEARPCRSGKTILQYDLDYGVGSPIGRQSLEVAVSPRYFHINLAPSRTFLLETEAAALKAQGIGQRATYRDLLVFGSHGPIDNELRFPDECVRHKLLDLVGDLALAGCDLVGRFHASRSGHRLNAELVRTLLGAVEGRVTPKAA